MNRFDGPEEAVGAYIDGEVSDLERMEIRTLIDESDEWRLIHDELQRVRRATQALFSEVELMAPPAPLRRDRFRRRPWSYGLGLVAAAAAILGFVFYFTPGETAAARTPIEVFKSAARRISGQNDVTLVGRIEFPGAQALIVSFGGTSNGASALGMNFRALVDHRNRYLLQAAEEADRAWSSDRSMSGYDGNTFWSFDASNGHVERSSEKPLTGDLRVSLAADGAQDFLKRPILDYLAWGFLEGLGGDHPAHRFREVTWPADRRAGRQVFELEAVDPPKKGGPVVSRLQVTVDPARDRVERLQIEASLAGFSLFRLILDVEAENSHPDAALFSPERLENANR